MLINAVREFSSEILHSHIQRMTNYLVHQASVEFNLYLYVLWSMYLVDTGDFHLAGLVLQETWKHTGFALTMELLFELSFDKNILKNLCHWLGLQTIARGYSY